MKNIYEGKNFESISNKIMFLLRLNKEKEEKKIIVENCHGLLVKMEG